MYAYNPRKKSFEELDQSLVGDDRWDILNGLLTELALKEGESPKQHWMIVGARGMGKSHLLTLLYHKVRNDYSLNKLWIPVLLPEEIRMAGDLARFLERAINEVLRDLQREDSAAAADLSEKIGRLRSIPTGERVEYLFSLMSWIRRETGRHILLITENLQQLLGKKISVIDQKKLRAFLQSEDALLLIGSATTIFAALHDHGHPFYHFFHIRRLQELTFEDVKKLVGNLLSGHETGEQARILTENEARLKVIHSFTGGNPRMAVFLSDILKTDINEEMIHIMDRILDELTPYFEAIISDTPEYLQDILNTLAAYEPAQSPKEIAHHLEMEQGTVRNYLKQAKESGYVRVAFGRGKSNYYCLNEYLYRTWFQMRDSSHREEMRWLMELMLFLYSREHLFAEKERVKQYGGDDGTTYQRLVAQTYDYMIKNTKLCSMIESCVQQSNKSQIKRTKQKLSNIASIKSEMERRMLVVEKQRETITTRQYNRKLLEIYRDTMRLVDDGVFFRACSNALSAAHYLNQTWDIAGAVRAYKEDVVDLRSSVDFKQDGRYGLDLEDKATSFFAHIAFRNYDAAVAYLPLDDPKAAEAAINLLIIEVLYQARQHEYTSAFKSYDALYAICNAMGEPQTEVRVYMVLMVAHELRVISTDMVSELIQYCAAKSKVAILSALLWSCVADPDSEESQKLLCEPPIAQLVEQVKDLLAAAKEEDGLN